MAEHRTIRLGLIQMSCSLDPRENQAKAETKIAEAAREGAQVICLPELYRSQYFCREERADLFDLAEAIPGPSTAGIGRVAREHKVTVVASLFERRAAGLYHNTAAVIGPDGEIIDIYRKMHIPDDPLYFEKFYFTPGDLGFKNIDTPHGRLGVLVCWDQWYPEGARVTAMLGADVLLYPTAIGWHPAEKARYGEAQQDAWRTIQRSHAIANGIFVAAVNRVGYEGPRPVNIDDPEEKTGIEFFGTTFLSGPFGRVLAQADASSEVTLHHTIDTRESEEVRRNWPFFRDRRIDAYGPVLKRWGR